MSIKEQCLQLKQDFDEVYEAGKKAEYDEFWDTFQNYGNRNTYSYAFAGAGWTLKNFKPKYDINVITSSTAMFYSAFTLEDEPVNLVEELEKLGKTLTIDVYGVISDLFYNAKISHIGDCEVSDINTATGLTNWFRSPYIEEIGLVTLNTGGNIPFTNTFSGASALRKITFAGVIGQNLTMSACANLDYDSLQNIIGCLMDLSGTTTTRTLTLRADAKARLSESDIATITQKGWSLA